MVWLLQNTKGLLCFCISVVTESVAICLCPILRELLSRRTSRCKHGVVLAVFWTQAATPASSQMQGWGRFLHGHLQSTWAVMGDLPWRLCQAPALAWFSLWREAERQGTARGSPGTVEGWDGHLPVCAISPQEDLAEGRAHGLLQRGLLPSPGHCSPLRHRTSCVLRRHRGIPAGHAPQAPGLAQSGCVCPPALCSAGFIPVFAIRVDRCQSNSTKGSRGDAKGPGAQMGRRGEGESLPCRRLEPAPSCSFHGQYLIIPPYLSLFNFPCLVLNCHS